MANPIVTSLPEYVEQNKLGLIAKSVLGARTTGIINFQTGIKSKATINILDTDVTLQDGSACGFNAQGSQTVTQRVIETKPLKVNMEYCAKNMLKTFMQHEVRLNAGAKNLPFEEEFVGAVIEDVKGKVEKMIWQGDVSLGIVGFDGIFESLVSDPTVRENLIEETETVSDMVKKMVVHTNLPLKEDTKIFMGTDLFTRYIQELIESNLYHYSGENSNYEITVPGTTIKVVAVEGLNGTGKAFAGRASNFYYGTDMEGDEEIFDLFFSNDDRNFKLVIEFNCGVQIAFPTEVLRGTVAPLA